MRKWWVVLALTLYLSLDVANPLMPGAVTFGIESSVELGQTERFRGYYDVPAPGQSFDPSADIADDVVINAPRRVEAVPPGSPVRRARSSLFATSVPSEDPLILRS